MEAGRQGDREEAVGKRCLMVAWTGEAAGVERKMSKAEVLLSTQCLPSPVLSVLHILSHGIFKPLLSSPFYRQGNRLGENKEPDNGRRA